MTESCLTGCYWSGGICSVCGNRLRCGACGRFITIETIDEHIEKKCPVRWDEFEATAEARLGAAT